LNSLNNVERLCERVSTPDIYLVTVSVWLEKGFQWINFNVDWQKLFIQSTFVINGLQKAESKR